MEGKKKAPLTPFRCIPAYLGTAWYRVLGSHDSEENPESLQEALRSSQFSGFFLLAGSLALWLCVGITRPDSFQSKSLDSMMIMNDNLTCMYIQRNSDTLADWYI